MKTLFLATIILFGTITVAAKHGVIPQDSIAYYRLTNDTMQIILEKKSKWELTVVKKDSLWIKIHKMLDSTYTYTEYIHYNYTVNYKKDTLRFEHKKKYNKFIKKLRKELVLLNTLDAIEKNKKCDVYVDPAPQHIGFYFIYVGRYPTDDPSKGVSAPQHYIDRCCNQYEKQFLLIINQFFALINQPPLLPITYSSQPPCE